MEHDLDVLAQRLQLVARRSQQVLPVEQQRAFVGVEEPQQDARERRLAAARFADEAEHLAVEDVEVDVVDGPHAALDAPERPAAQRERLDDPAGLDQRPTWKSRQIALTSALLVGTSRHDRPPTVTATSSTVASLCRKQRTWVPSSSSTRAGVAWVQRSIRSGQRSAKRHPGGGSTSVGTRPGITVSSLVTDTDDRDRTEQPPCVRVLGIGEQRLDRCFLDDLAAVHHGDAVGHLGDDAEVVGDQHDARARARPAGRASGRGSAPGS